LRCSPDSGDWSQTPHIATISGHLACTSGGGGLVALAPGLCQALRRMCWISSTPTPAELGDLGGRHAVLHQCPNAGKLGARDLAFGGRSSHRWRLGHLVSFGRCPRSCLQHARFAHRVLGGSCIWNGRWVDWRFRCEQRLAGLAGPGDLFAITAAREWLSISAQQRLLRRVGAFVERGLPISTIT
jgi:hypothetical protein